MNKKRIFKIVDIVFVVIILISTFHTIYTKYYFRLVYIYGIIDTLLKCMLLLGTYLAIRIAFSKAHERKFSEIDLKNDNYYREILYKYSPAVLKYIDNFEHGEAIIIIILMGLKLKGIINNELEIINNDFSELDLNELYICTHMKKFKEIDMNELKYTVIHDCKKYGLLKDYTRKNEHDISFKLASVLWIVAVFITIILGSIHYILPILLAALIIITIISYAVYNMTLDEMDYETPYIRTRKGEALNEKLEGLRKYLNDYSLLDTKSEEELVIWEDYLIYSVMFEQNEKIIKEYKEKIDRE